MIGGSINVVLLYPVIRPVLSLSPALESCIKSSDIVLTIFRKIPQEFNFRSQIISVIVKSKKPRLAHMPEVNMDIISNCILKSDYDEMLKLGSLLIQGIARAKNVKVISSNGTNFSLDLGAWAVLADADFRPIESPGTWGNLPIGEVFKIPINHSAKGKLVIDGAVSSGILSKHETITLQIQDGVVFDIKDKSNTGFKNYLNELNRSAADEEKNGIFTVSEIGIGINRSARKIPSPIEYELNSFSS